MDINYVILNINPLPNTCINAKLFAIFTPNHNSLSNSKMPFICDIFYQKNNIAVNLNF